MRLPNPENLWRAFKRRVLIKMALIRRQSLTDTALIGITGSCAKTTTKTLLAGILARQYDVAQNPGSDNRIGTLARSILKTKTRRGVCVQEFGAHGVGSLDEMVALFQPTVAVITNVMRDHYTAFRSLEAIAGEKSKLVAALPVSGTAVLNADDPLVMGMRAKVQGRVMTYGFAAEADLRALGFDARWPGHLKGSVAWKGKNHPVQTRLLGEHWTPAILAAMAAALSLGMEMQTICAALGDIEPPEGRYSTARLPNGAIMVCDDFKAPMHSIQPALTFLRTARADRKTIVVGHISDFSNSSSYGYKRVASQASDVCDRVLLVSRFASERLQHLPGHHRGQVHCFGQLKAAKDFLAGYIGPGDLVVLKGIRKMDHFERLVMAFDEGIACWQSLCGLQGHCRRCPRRHRATPAGSDNPAP